MKSNSATYAEVTRPGKRNQACPAAPASTIMQCVQKSKRRQTYESFHCWEKEKEGERGEEEEALSCVLCAAHSLYTLNKRLRTTTLCILKQDDQNPINPLKEWRTWYRHHYVGTESWFRSTLMEHCKWHTPLLKQYVTYNLHTLPDICPKYSFLEHNKRRAVGTNNESLAFQLRPRLKWCKLTYLKVIKLNKQNGFIFMEWIEF